MRTACQNLRSPREPTAKEFEDMAKALVEKYPCLGQLYDEEKKYFRPVGKDKRARLTQEQNNKLHVSLEVCLDKTCILFIVSSVCLCYTSGNGTKGERLSFLTLKLRKWGFPHSNSLKPFGIFLLGYKLMEGERFNRRCYCLYSKCYEIHFHYLYGKS